MKDLFRDWSSVLNAVKMLGVKVPLWICRSHFRLIYGVERGTSLINFCGFDVERHLQSRNCIQNDDMRCWLSFKEAADILENPYHFLVLKFCLVQVEVIGGNRRSLGQCMYCAYHEVNYKEADFQAEERRRKRKRNENWGCAILRGSPGRPWLMP